MKKTLLIFLVLCICLFALWSCGKMLFTDAPATDDSTTDEPTTDIPTTDSSATDDPTTDAPTADITTADASTTNEPATDVPTTDVPTTDAPATDEPVVVEPFVITNSEIKLKQVYWDGFGYSTKTIPEGELTMSIINELAKMPEIGVLVDKISDESLDELTDYSLLAGGTMWLEVASQIYRLSPDLTSGCHVATHLGEGYVINLSDEFRSLVNDAWSYYPHNYYKGEYIKATGEIKLERVFAADSTVMIGIKSIDLGEGTNPTNKIILGLTSTVGQEVEISLDCKRSDDDLAAGDYKKVYLGKGKEKEVELAFGGWDNSSYRIYVSADNTCLELEINTRDLPDYDYSDILIGAKNSGASIRPVQTLSWLVGYESGEQMLNADGAGCYQLFYDQRFKITHLPTVIATDELTATLPQSSEIRSISVYDFAYEPVEYEIVEFSKLHLLPAGEYIVVIYQITDESVIDPDAESYNVYGYEDVFHLIVPKSAETTLPEMEYYPYGILSIGVKNSTESIKPRRAFARTQELDENYRVVAYANGLGYKRLFDGESFDISDLPVIAATDELTLTKPDGMRVAGGLYIYDLEGNPYKYDRADLEDLHLLPPGEYVVRLTEIIEARDGDETYFRTEYDNVFRLVVPERVLGDVSHSLSFNDTSLILDDYFDINATYRTGERVELPIELLFDVSCRAFANGEEIPRLTDSFDYGMVFVFFMPDEDVYIEIQVTDIPGSPL